MGEAPAEMPGPLPAIVTRRVGSLFIKGRLTINVPCWNIAKKDPKLPLVDPQTRLAMAE